MLVLDAISAVEEGISQRQPQRLRFGPGGGGSEQPRAVLGQLWVDRSPVICRAVGHPQFSRMLVRVDYDTREFGGEPVQVLVADALRRRQSLGRRTQPQRRRFARPPQISLALNSSRSSCRVMCATTQI